MASLEKTVKKTIDDEVCHAMHKLKVTSRAAVTREDARYPEIDDGGFWCDDGHQSLPAALTTRVKCISLLDALIRDGQNTALPTVDCWLTRLGRLLPKAADRPITDAELAPVLERAKRYEKELGQIKAESVKRGAEDLRDC